MTKYRHKVFTDRHSTRLEEVMRAVCEDFEADLVEFNGENSHVQRPRELPAQGRPVQAPQQNTGSRRTRQEFPDLVRHYYRANKLWSGSYFAGPADISPLSTVKQYIKQQNQPP